MSIFPSLIIGEILNYLDVSYPVEKLFIKNGWALAVLLFGTQVLYAVSSVVSRSTTNVMQTRVRAALVSAIYQKSLKLSPKLLAQSLYSAGKINTLASSDITAILGFIDSVNQIWSMPLQVALVLFFVSRLLGVSATIGAAVFIAFGGLASALSPAFGTNVKMYMQATDQRTTILREFLYGVKVVKYHALEERVLANIQKTRDSQVRVLYKYILVFVLMISAMVFQQGLTPLLTFVVFGALGNNITPNTIFPALSFLTSLVSISVGIPRIVGVLIQSSVSYERVCQFLMAEEVTSEDLISFVPLSESQPSILLSSASFTWESANKQKFITEENKIISRSISAHEDAVLNRDDKADIFTLEKISLSVKRGSLIAVVGATGSGKSSLLAALAGSMRKLSGKASIAGNLAYCSQEPWIISGTIAENITLHNTTARPFVATALMACSLNEDIKSFEQGIHTHIGEKGINLSGGQKARLALARAIAQNPDIFILDDPLSALDVHVSKSVFHGTIKSQLIAGKTIVLATNLLAVLPHIDQIIVMDSGKIVQIGSFTEIISDTNGLLFHMMKDYHLDSNDFTEIPENSGNNLVNLQVGEVQTELAEDRETGAVSANTYKTYAKAIGITGIIMQLICVIVLVAFYVMQQLTLSAWTTNYWGFVNPELLYLMIAAERLSFYITGIPVEAPRISTQDSVIKNWPSSGSIEVKDLVLAYATRPEHHVIDGISLRIKDREKIAVVGRTGSGKSTLMDSLFRIIEAKKGAILIDGQDISFLGLKKLRSSMQMIPQSPILFDGTIRTNIDSSHIHDDKIIWNTLKCVGMHRYVSQQSGKLDSPVSEGGANFSAGQRQLLCLAKALLNNSKILILDEATSSIDAESDKLIQNTIATQFSNATVLSVAHRLNTIAGYDKVLVLEKGKVAEFDAPYSLLRKENSIFREMVNATGDSNAAVFANIAKNHYFTRM
ncbi:hypothetical protein HK100_001100 [Physocladia obscura]|uniref:P-loop containing nucleoside triphosphate hydrolase protein n=1 Tax=Physocladia obscura TaxID=109957 RepID=A0AAD5SZ68_9FUNG|nr:hypothetical protein HK100_001100 [Physocladia obscura]